MRALRFPKPYQAEIVEVPRPEIRGARQAILKVEACGICASDVMAYKGSHPYRKPPVITGHEIVGSVVETGAGVTQLKPGDRVAIEPHIGCGDCYYCEIGEYQQCKNKGLIGVGDWIGGFAEFIVVEESMCYRIPDHVSFEVGALLEPYNVGVHAVMRGAIQTGESVGVVGTGTIGLVTLLAVTKGEHGRIVVTDVSDKKLAVAKSLGADVALNPSKVSVQEELAKYEPEGLDVVLLTVPKEEAIDQALSMCKRQARVILIATLGEPVKIDTHKIQQFERTITGTAMYNRDDWLLSVEHIGTGDSSAFETLISNRISLDHAPAEIDRLAHGLSPDNIKTIITSFGA